MKTSEIRLLSKPKLNDPVFILGLSEQQGINSIVARALIEHTRAEKFAELYSPHFPDYVIAEETGLCHLPRYDLYASELFDPNIVIMSGDAGPSPDDGQAHYEVFNTTLGFARELGCRRFLSFGSFQAEKAEDKIYVAATTGRLVSSVTGKLGGKPFAKGRIDGLIGMILGLARVQGFPAICVLGLSEKNRYPDDTAHEIFYYVLDVLRLKTR